MKKIYFYIIVICVIWSISAVSCEKEEETLGDIELPPAPLISQTENWAVIETDYLRLRERPEKESPLVTTLWKGYVLEVLSRNPAKVIMDGFEDYWYKVNYDGLQGWVFGSYLKIFNSREAAEVGARSIRAD